MAAQLLTQAYDAMSVGDITGFTRIVDANPVLEGQISGFLTHALQNNMSQFVRVLSIRGAVVHDINVVLTAFTLNCWASLRMLARHTTDKLTLDIILYWAVAHDAEGRERGKLAALTIERGATIDDVLTTLRR